MTIAQVEGGLASQMFGYAAARRLALRHGEKVLIDARNFRTYQKFSLELHHLDIDAVLLTDEQADEICGVRNELMPVVAPRHLHFDKGIVDLPTARVLMRGNYVCEDYFSDIAEVLRNDFRRITEPGEHTQTTRAMLEAKRGEGWSPVAVHVRRGDYAHEVGVNRAHGLCTDSYYERAFSLLRRLVERPWFFVFSNDPAWIEGQFSGPDVTAINTPPATAPVEDMMLMAECDHHVIANSGYSWWGAWLARSRDQVVIGPRPFMADRSLNTEDIMPRHWLSLGIQPEAAGA